MSKEKPISIYGEGGKVSDTITWNEGGMRIIERIDISTNGNTGLTKEIQVTDLNGSVINPLDKVHSKVLEFIQNSSIREQKYQEKMNKIRRDALKNGTNDDFVESLKKNGTFDAVMGTSSINDIEIKGENARNNEKKAEEEKDQRAKNDELVREFNKDTQVKQEELYYPIDMITDVDDSQDYIYIEQYSYQPPQPSGNPPSEVVKGGVTRFTNIEEKYGGCKLPIPNRLGVSNGVNWGEARANALELSAFGSAKDGIQRTLQEPGKILKVITEGLKETGGTLAALRDDVNAARGNSNIVNSSTILSGVLARSALGSIGINVDVDQFITRQTGAAINPNLELLFGGPQLRSFNFDFNFAPNGVKEATMVRKIQRWFKQGMLPSRRRATASSASSLFLASPNVFRITYKNNKRRIKGLNTFKICALTSVQVDFTPDGVYQSYEDENAVSMPVRSTMALSFTELTPIFRDDYHPDNNDPSMEDAGLNASGENRITDNDIGF